MLVLEGKRLKEVMRKWLWGWEKERERVYAGESGIKRIGNTANSITWFRSIVIIIFLLKVNSGMRLINLAILIWS